MEELKKEENQEDVKNNKKNNNKDLEKIKELIEIQKKEIEEKDDRLKRLMAEFENFKKRSSKEREGLYNSLVADITSSLLPIIDNLEKAVQVKTEDENFKQGIELVLKQFKDVLASNGVTEIETVGKTFDPELHEAITSVVDDNLGVQEIKEEYRKGYMIGNKVIRHSLVVVAN
ncbi:MAG: nucleotide exchange factor GrpE [Clostridia bacterium]|nr:nucleotide exchange factor GrpE [Clostridia bacterium]